MKSADARKERDIQVLQKFIEVYCEKQHGAARRCLCDECSELLAYAADRLAKCPLDPKPKCKACRVHCYDEQHRRRIKEVMKFSGMHFIKRGRIDWLLRYFLA